VLRRLPLERGQAFDANALMGIDADDRLGWEQHDTIATHTRHLDEKESNLPAAFVEECVEHPTHLTVAGDHGAAKEVP
jgi:hypothetical protein